MILIKSVLLLLTSLSFTQPLEITKLGARPKECKSAKDIETLSIDNEFKIKSQQLFESDSLKLALVSGSPCFRVGTEISLQHASGDIRYLGKALINKLELMNAKELLTNKSSKTLLLVTKIKKLR